LSDAKPINAIKKHLIDKSMIIDKELDVKGEACPLPLLKAKLAMNELFPGNVLKVITTDRGSLRDFPVFSSLSGHELLLSDEVDGVCVHILRKKQGD